MATYLLIYHGGSMPDTDEAQAQTMAAWGAWFESLGAAVVDGGNPIGPSLTVGSDGSVSAGGGSNPASGYSLIEAASIEEAAEKAKGCPILSAGGTIEVGETFNVG